MPTFEFDLSTVNSIEVEANDGEEAIHDLLVELEDLVSRGRIQANEVKTYDVEAKATGCVYRVAGMSAAEAEDNLRTFIQRERDALKENVLPGDPGNGLLTDLNTSCETVGEVEGDWDINRSGEAEY
jgi:hypothetical protein